MGAHPYHPVYLLPLVELVKGEKTNPECLKALVQFYRSIEKNRWYCIRNVLAILPAG